MPETQSKDKNKVVQRRNRITRRTLLGAALVLIALLMLWRGNAALDFDVRTILTLEAGQTDDVASITVPTLLYMNIMAIFFLVTGGLAIANPPQLRTITRIAMLGAGIVFIPTIFIIAAAGDSTNAVTMVTESFRLATPIAIGAMAGIWCERSGVVNIAIEGMMLFSACFAFTALFFINQALPPEQLALVQLVAVLVGILTGGLVALLHAWLSITFSTDQIVSGTVINILALGVTSFVRREYLLSTDAGLTTLPDVRIPILADIPIVGEALFNNQPIFYLMFVVVIATYLVLFQTKWGLRVRSVGENPGAADTLGIPVNRVRWAAVFIGGMIAGLAGTWFTIEATGRFTDGMTNGTGFIALAAVIFGDWMPGSAFGGALLFGFADALGTRFQIIDVPVPNQFLQMVPYIVTLIVLAGFRGSSHPPAALGTAYKKE